MLNRSQYKEPVSRVESIQKTTDNIYLNVVFDHPDVIPVPSSGPLHFPTSYSTGEDPIDCEYIVTKTDPILNKCSDYQVSVVRFTIPLSEVPLGICQIVPNQLNPDLTPMIIGIDRDVTSNNPLTKFPVNCIYVPQNNIQSPVQNSNLQIITPYYYIHSYDQYINMFNASLLSAWTSSGLDAIFPNYLPPYFYLDFKTNLVNLVVPQCFVRLVAPLTAIPFIFMNVITQNFLDAFNTTYVGIDQPQGNDSYFLLSQLDKPENYYYPSGTTIPSLISPAVGLPGTPFYFKFCQEYSVLEYWTSLRKILITTSTIPIRSEFIPVANNIVGFGNSMNNPSSQSLPIISDFVPAIDSSAGSSRSIAYYLPSAQYRMTDLISDAPLQTISIKILWQDINGNVYPIRISALQQASMKILFTRKK